MSYLIAEFAQLICTAIVVFAAGWIAGWLTIELLRFIVGLFV